MQHIEPSSKVKEYRTISRFIVHRYSIGFTLKRSSIFNAEQFSNNLFSFLFQVSTERSILDWIARGGYVGIEFRIGNVSKYACTRERERERNGRSSVRRIRRIADAKSNRDALANPSSISRARIAAWRRFLPSTRSPVLSVSRRESPYIRMQSRTHFAGVLQDVYISRRIME